MGVWEPLSTSVSSQSVGVRKRFVKFRSGVGLSSTCAKPRYDAEVLQLTGSRKAPSGTANRCGNGLAVLLELDKLAIRKIVIFRCYRYLLYLQNRPE